MVTNSYLRDSIELRCIRPNDEILLLDFFNILVSNGLDAFFHPHPFNSETAQKIACYVGFDWYTGVFLKSENSETIVAYAMLRGWDEGYTIPSFGVCVLPSYQKMRIGQMLINASVVVAKVRGCQKIRLTVHPDNLTAIASYRRFGFEFQSQLYKNQLVGYLIL